MPSPSTTDLPSPKSWDEFEDICADLISKIWNDPYITRNGRSGQSQDGVDIYGYPQHLGGMSSQKIAAVQCKETEQLTLRIVKNEVDKASRFKPAISEYLVMTTAPRDARLQEAVRIEQWPFPVRLLFWEDISLALSGQADLLKKHFPAWFKVTTSKQDVIDLLYRAKPDDFEYNDVTGKYLYKNDIDFVIELDRGPQSEENFHEPWVEKYPDSNAFRCPVRFIFKGTLVHEMLFVHVDGGRYLVPIPKSMHELTISKFQYHIARILNSGWEGYGIDVALKRAGIIINSEEEL